MCMHANTFIKGCWYLSLGQSSCSGARRSKMEAMTVGANAHRPILPSVARAVELAFSSLTAVVPDKIGLIWRQLRQVLLIPAMRVALVMCLVMSVMLVVEKLYMALVTFYVKVFNRKPEKVYKWEPIKEDPELGNLAYPMVLVQIPMFNEREVYQLSISAVCNFAWPADRLIVQVLDDSTDLTIRELVQMECQKWLSKGINIYYISRDNRNGYKAGAMKEAMEFDYVEQCDYVTVFDADFQPASDFLMRTVPFLIHNPKIALVQTRWKFVNVDECMMTRIQEMSLNYHFKIEQESGSATVAFFGFNGTAGVWRIQAINEAGGWKDRTTVEDMDLAVRAALGGWKFVYLGDIKVKSELPSTYKAYRYQQHRWACGPANLFRKMLWDIVRTKKVSPFKKFYVIYNFFFARRIVSHFVTFVFYSIVIPLSVFFCEIEIPKWGAVYIPTTITLLNLVVTPRSIHLIIFWIFFENVMSLHRCKAVFIGLFEADRVNEWVVTEKLGDTLKTKPHIATKKFRIKFWERVQLLELVVGVYLMICAYYDYFYRKGYYFIYFFPQAISFFIMGFGYIGTIIPNNK